MKSPFFFIILGASLLFLLVSCGEVSSGKQEAWNLVLKDGLLYKDSLATEPFTGHYKGKVMGKDIEYEVLNGKKHGVFAIYHENGNVETLGYLENDQNHGIWKYYYPNGIVESIGNFNLDKPDSVWNWYYMTGTLRQEGRFEDGKKEGEWNYYDDFGNLYLTMKYKEDVLKDSVAYKLPESDSNTDTLKN